MKYRERTETVPGPAPVLTIGRNLDVKGRGESEKAGKRKREEGNNESENENDRESDLDMEIKRQNKKNKVSPSIQKIMRKFSKHIHTGSENDESGKEINESMRMVRTMVKNIENESKSDQATPRKPKTKVQSLITKYEVKKDMNNLSERKSTLQKTNKCASSITKLNLNGRKLITEGGGGAKFQNQVKPRIQG